VIRGLDGDRVRLLENGVGTLDASAASPDHAVSVDPLILDSVDVIRGPSALLYGSSAIGGVVNVRTVRIGSQPIDAPELKLSGLLSSVDRGRALGVLGRTRTARWVLEADVSARGSEDVETPIGQIRNSAARNYQAGIGATYFGRHSRYGVALSAIKNFYGTVAEPDVQIDLERFRLDLETETRLENWLETARIKGAVTSYRHEERVGETVGTTFRNRGGELRADLKHRPSGAMEGLIGAQAQLFEFSALGEEAFLPTTFNQSYAAFAFEEWNVGAWRPSAGLRLETARVQARESVAFGPGQNRDFFAPSGSLGIAYSFRKETTLGLHLTYTERAPNYQELFANGEHVATGIFEVGHADLHEEHSAGAELAFRHREGEVELRTAVFVQNFGSFIALVPTGATSAGGLSIYDYATVSARLTGFEGAVEFPLVDSLAGGKLAAELRVDTVYGRDLTRDTFLPRMPPFREGATMSWRRQGWYGFAELQRSERQHLVAPGETETPAYQLVNFGVEAPFDTALGALRLSLRLNNAFDALARMHTSFLKDIAPLPGRNLVLGVQAAL
jgi:iron complex outermembrane receptor protein